MSRSRHGRKPPGWDYWGKRQGLGLGAYGRPKAKKESKRNGIQRERAMMKLEMKKLKEQDNE